ncbi:hypothetical protein P12x_003092 [Tundrisphaera lichenicola]|uniref:hypothetical protein n=1 Tax=Tundrisphaera lichenicola TaxID=2029860 RepID=UPI003EB842E3
MAARRRWFRFNLQAGMGLVIVCAVLLAILIVPAHRRGRAFADIRAAGGTIMLQPGAEESWFDKLVGRALGPDYVAKVYSIDLRKSKINNDFLACLGAFPEIGKLDLEAATISDDALEYFKSLGSIRELWIGETAITDAGLAKLVLHHPRLDTLSLQGTKVTQVGLAELAKLPLLTDLLLNSTETNDKGLEKLATVKSLEDLGLRGTKVTSEGLMHLKRLPKLAKIRLYYTGVDDTGVKLLSEIPTLSLVDLSMTKITDVSLDYLARLPRLDDLDVTANKISPEALKAFQQTHPKCTIQ